MKYRSLGRSGLKVSEIALGSWLTYGGNIHEENAVQCIDTAYELGVNYFDTSNNYNDGMAEVIVGKGLKKYPRERYIVATKGYHPKGCGPNERGLSRKYIIEQVNNSLKRLQLEYVDIFYCHKFDFETPVDETLRAIDDLITQGKILYPGVSKWSVNEMELALQISKELRLDPIIVDQPLYNLLEREIETDILPFAQQSGMGIVVFSPLAQGLLTGKYQNLHHVPDGSRADHVKTRANMNRLLTEKNIRLSQSLKAVADRKGCTLPHLALAWILRHPQIASAIIGATNPGQIEENSKAIDIELTADEMKDIETIFSAEC